MKSRGYGPKDIGRAVDRPSKSAKDSGGSLDFRQVPVTPMPMIIGYNAEGLPIYGSGDGSYGSIRVKP
jgi:hypothetical protein